MFKVLCPRNLISLDGIVKHPLQTGHLLGIVSGNVVCITKLINSKTETAQLTCLNESVSDVCIIGELFISDGDLPIHRDLPRLSSGESQREFSVMLALSKSGLILGCSVFAGKEAKSSRDHVLLSYDPEEFVHSFIPEGKDGNEIISIIRRALMQERGGRDMPSLIQHSEFGMTDEAMLSIGKFLARTASFLPSPRSSWIGFAGSFACMPSTLDQEARRCRQMRCRVEGVTRDPSSKLNQHIFKSFIWMVTFDILLGLVAMVVFQHYEVPDHLGGFLVSSAEWIGVELEKLLSWLVGAPAGLKLNRPLAKFLSTFFLHHVNLWRAYINLLQPLWGTILDLCSISGIFGFSLQVAILRDVISTMTIHVYCFYVYAARLYSLQLASLASLWRLFRGKKWNRLRNRVDSTYFDIDSMFLGTLCFAVLFFLLPTTVIFYAVFAALRLAVLTMQGFLGLTISLVEGLPLYWAYLRLFDRKKVAGTLSMSVGEAGGPLCLHVKLNPIPFSELIKLDASISSSSSSSSSSPVSSSSSMNVSDFFAKLITGRLICPWIKS